ncbi:hypothetical protein LTR84_008870 [Exophiala bonariae]|uniref:Uncharacterized protein n=1 Tax=Exophiala bonariae TaxID=1690606 RepID=A0AAV9MWX0_9EURO|nr:hypothetical protein LTR84_008870 [Exophiala bonariae]
MYRNSAHINYLSKPSLPSPEHTGDSDSELLDALERKRKQLDDEISKFKAIKEKEFRDFENDLRTRCKRKRSRGSSTSSEPSPPGKHTSTAASHTSVLYLLASAHNGSANGKITPKIKKGAEYVVGDKITRPAPLSKPTLSLDRLNISGETTPPTNTLGTPPTPTGLPRATVCRSPSSSTTRLTTPPRSNSETPALTTPTLDRFDSFAGVFTPAYLPLLESRDHTPVTRTPQPLSSPEEADAKQLQSINADSKRTAEQQPVKSQSLPRQPVSPTVVATKRTHSSPLLPSTSLPSALRNSNGKIRNGSDSGQSAIRKRKQVTFQLADSAIVIPSSSYQELPSPEPKSAGTPAREVIILKNGEEDDGVEGSNSFAIGSHGSPNRQAVENKSNDDNTLSPNISGQRKNRLRSPAISPLPSPSPSPTINGIVASADESGFSGGLAASVDGGSGVGFFELDEELASPAFAEDRSFEFSKVEGQDEAKVDEDFFLDEKKAEVALTGDEVQVGSFAAGSVPININRHPTGSWIGSYGH